MTDNLIYLIKNFPKLIQHSFAHLKLLWKWLVSPIVVSLLILVMMILVFHFNKTPDIVQARWYIRLVSFISFSFLCTGIYVIYQRYYAGYYTGKMFNTPVFFDAICIAFSYIVALFIILFICIFSTPVNIVSSIFATLYYVIMLGILMILIGEIFGQMTILKLKVRNIFIVLIIIVLLLLPIIYIPSSETSVFTHLLMINPIFYVIQGLAQSVVFGALSLNNIPYHLYFFCIIGIVGVILFALKRKVTYAKYNLVSPPHVNNDKEETQQDNHIAE